jgi:hypothetical protein
MSDKHPCLDLPPHLKRTEQVIELPQSQSFLRRLLARIRK